MGRREALAIFGAVAAACGAKHPEPPREPARPAPLKLEPLVDLIPTAALAWLVQARPGELASDALLAPAIGAVVPEERFAAFALRHGGVDLRQARELVVAGFPETTLTLARLPVSEALIESAFAARASAVDGRAIEGSVTRFWGTVGLEREQVAVFGGDAVGLERGHLGPMRASLQFAAGKLRRAVPALRAEPLARAAVLLDGDGPAPIRGFAPGPFEGDWAAGLGGLLRATTAIAGAARPRPLATPGEQKPSAALWVTLLLTGAWGDQAGAAADRLGAAFRVLAEDPLGRLLGLDHPLDGPRVSGEADAVRLDVTLDPLAIGRGLRAATSATMREILAY